MSILKPHFQTFYYELLKQKEKALRLGEIQVDENEGDGVEIVDGDDASHLVSSIQARLQGILLAQHQELQRQSGTLLRATHIFQFQYVLAALADEILIQLEWRGRNIWGNRLLETQMFGTQMAGENVFAHIDALIDQLDPLGPELAEVYLFAIGLGFRGRYRDDDEMIHRYQTQLMQKVHGGQNERSYRSSEHLMQQCYQHTFTEPPGRGLPDIKTWSCWIAAVLIGYWVISHGVWHHLSRDIRRSLDQIMDQARFE